MALRNTLSFVAGFSVVFIGLWVHRPDRPLTWDPVSGLRVAGGVLLIVMGLHVAGLVDIGLLNRSVRPQMGSSAGPVATQAGGAGALRSGLMGVVFGVG